MLNPLPKDLQALPFLCPVEVIQSIIGRSWSFFSLWLILRWAEYLGFICN